MKKKIESTLNQEQNEVIKKDNKKAGIKFGILMICSILFGLVVGFFSIKISAGLVDLPDRFQQFMFTYGIEIGTIYSIIMVIVTLLAIVWIISNTQYIKKNVERLTGSDDDTEISKIDRKLSFGSSITNALFVLYFIYFSIMVFLIINFVEQYHLTLMITAMIIFLIGMLGAVFLQQRVVDCTRLMNPEKKGSVFDINFRRKWEDSSDEAELFTSYKAAYMSYRVVSMLCGILWLIFMMIGLVTGVGFLPVITVLIIWAALIFVYSYYCIKYSN